MKDALTKQLLVRILEEAKQAHNEFEEQLGHVDEDWIEWYADFILARLDEELDEQIK